MTPTLTVPLAVLLAVAAGWLGLTQSLGAHPIWAAQVTWIGAPLGIGIAGVAHALRLPRMGAALAFAALMLAAFALATYGKTAFAASYAEDALAGRFWYFGWITTAAAFTAATATALTRRRAARPD